MSTDQSRTVGAVVGENIRRLREQEGWTQQELAVRLRAAGLDWTRDQVAAAEIGRREDIGVSDLVPLVHVFDVDAGELLTGAGDVRVGDHATMRLAGLWPKLASGDVDERLTAVTLDATAGETYVALLAGGLDADERLADRLGVDVATVIEAAEQRWGHSLTEERDRRVAELGDDAGDRRARRGHVTRALSAELADAITTQHQEE